MTLTEITFFFLGILAVIVIAMMVHTYLDKRKMKKNLTRLTEPLKGHVFQESPFHYPRFRGAKNDRTFDLFFHLVKVGRQHILYSIYSITASLPTPILLMKKGAFKPVADEACFSEANGVRLSESDLPFYGRSKQPQWAEQICNQKEVQALLRALDSFSSLQLGPDALVLGKPYEGLPSDTDPEAVLYAVSRLEQLAEALEQSPHHK